MYKRCPNCGVKAIVVNDEGEDDTVTCSSCQAEYVLKDLNP